MKNFHKCSLSNFKVVTPRSSWSSGESSVHNVTAGRDQTSWTVRGLQPAGTYHFRAAAANALGLGPFTQPPLLVVTDEEVPGSPPTEVSVQTLGPQSIKVTWKPPLPELRHGHIKGYYVGYKLHNSSELHLYKTVEARDADPEAHGECVLNNLRKHTKYSVLVQAYNAIGAGPRSDEAVVRTAQDVPQVAPPGVQCSSSSPTTIRVSWTKLLEKNLDGVHKGYRVIYRQIRTQHAQYEGFTGEEENSWAERDVNAGSSAAVLSSLEPYSNYSVRVAARTGAGAGAFSDPVHCSTPEAVPQAPEDIKALILAPDAILVSWKPPVRSRGVLLRYTVYSRSHGYRKQAAAAIGPGSAAPPAADVGPVRHVAVPSSQFWHETRGLRTGQRYEFWVTASTAAGEGPATRIVTQSPEIRAPARIASFNRDVSVALKQDLELPCRTVGQPMPIREWRTGGGALEETDRVRVLPSGTLRIESAEQPDSANYSCHAHNVYGRDSVHYTVHVHKYELHYKRQQGSWDLVRVAPPASVLGGTAPARSSVATVSASWSNGTRLTHELTGLFCGTQYHIYLVAVGDKGKSDPSDTVFARTQGGGIQWTRNA
ncbi:Down syndrome cell adhesion molecule-like protein Dscam2 [Ixodes scapularis]|uniref:Down syndrome cell adhesion molecule-like protein Dscam2 n=1 Tax=Ixodes scapularis TaxID=6945 RepID=UPI001C38BED2|nr:Down syndrome cell adhesion molecule-like protein Dscam2 [Ixodes scapularis]